MLGGADGESGGAGEFDGFRRGSGELSISMDKGMCCGGFNSLLYLSCTTIAGIGFPVCRMYHYSSCVAVSWVESDLWPWLIVL